MSEFRFIHSADIHLGSGMHNLEHYYGAPTEAVRSAPKEAFERLVDLAIENRVEALLIAGDLFDGKWPDASIGLWLSGQFRRLEQNRIRTFLICGNHDAQSVVRPTVQWPASVFEFSAEHAETQTLECGLAIHGRSFLTKSVTDDLTPSYPPKISGLFNVGMLHTSLSGDSNHDAYAPTDIPNLLQHQYDYWALGHIHQRSPESLAEQVWIGYSGNTQGRSVRETGPRGCNLVTVRDHRLHRLEFLETCKVQWEIVVVDVTDIDRESSSWLGVVAQRIEQELHATLKLPSSRTFAVRIELVGATNSHALLQLLETQDHLREQCRETANHLGNVWIEKIKIRTQPATQRLDNQVLRELRADVQSEILKLKRHYQNDDKLSDLLNSLQRKCGEHFNDVVPEKLTSESAWREKLFGWIDQAGEQLMATFENERE